MSTFLYALNLTWEPKNLRILYLLMTVSLLLISQPEKQNPQTLLYIIFIVIIPCPFDMCDIGILRTYISDYNAFFLHIKEYHIN